MADLTLQEQNQINQASVNKAAANNAISVQGLNTPIPTVPNIGTAPDFNPNYAMQVAGMGGTAKVNESSLTGPTTPTTPDTTTGVNAGLMASLKSMFAPPPSTADTYTSIYGVTPEQAKIDKATAQADFNAKQQAYKTSQSKYNALNAQIQGLDYQGNVVVPNQAIVDATGVRGTQGIADQTARNQRDILLQKAPLQYQALIAQAEMATAQGDAQLSQSILQQAQGHLDDLFKATTADATAQYEYRTNIADKYLQYADKEQAAKLEAYKTAEANAFTLKRDDINYARTLAKTAGDNGDFASVAKITALDPNSKTYNSDLALISGQIKYNNIDDLIKHAQLDKLNAEVKALNPSVGSITNPEASKYAGAISVVTGSKNFTVKQKADFINSVNNGSDPFAAIKNQAKDIMGQTEATKVTNYEVARDTLSDIGSQLAQFYANGGNTNIFSGNFEKVINKLGEVKDPKLVSLATQIQGNIQVYRNAISGTAYSAQEGRDITNIFPGINKSQSLNDAILKGRATLFDSVIDASYRTALGKTYDTLKSLENADTSNTPLTPDEAYAEYLKTTGQAPVAPVVTQPATTTPNYLAPAPKSSYLPDYSQGYKGFSLSSFFK